MVSPASGASSSGGSNAPLFSFGGLASGLDTAAIINALIARAGRPITLDQQQISKIKSKQTVLTQITGSARSLLVRASVLTDSTLVNGRTVTTNQLTSETAKLAATATSAAAIGSFTVDILSLASPTKAKSTVAVGQAVSQAVPLDQAGFATAPVAGTFTINTTQFTIPAATPSTAQSNAATGAGVSTTAMLSAAGLTIAPAGSGSFTINGYQISYDASVDSLSDMVQRINSSSAGVTASFDTGTDKLLLTANANGPAAITYADVSGNFLRAMNFVDGVGAPSATETAGTDLISLSDVVTMINNAAIGVTASIVNDSDGRANLLQLTSGAAIQLGNAGDTSNFLAITHLLESPAGTTRTSVANLGTLDATTELTGARLATALSQNSGSFTINGVAISYDATVDSLNNIISRINQSTAGVTATYDSTADRMTITANKTGSVGISLADTTGNLLDALEVLSATQTVGGNASYKIDGGATQYATTNQVTNAVTGVTLTLQGTTTSPITVTVSANTGQLKQMLSDFAEQFNSTIELIRQATAYNEQDKSKNGVLLGDSAMRSFATSLRTRVVTPAVGMSGSIRSLSDVGFSFGAVGSAVGTTNSLVFDAAKFDKALADDPAAVTQVLSGFSASASLVAGGTGSVASITGTPTTAKNAGTYQFTTTAAGQLTLTFQADDGSPLVVSNHTISPGEVNTTLIPGVTVTFDNPLVAGMDEVEIVATQEGVAKSIYGYVHTFTTANGVLDSRSTELQSEVDSLNQHIDRLQKRLDTQRQALVRKYAAFEVQMQKLNDQRSALNNFVAQITANRGTQ